MSLMKKHRTSQKKLAAIRRNQKLSHGPATAEGRARIGAAHLRHGAYSKAEEVALRTLGEEPAQFQELLDRLCGKYNPTDALQEELVARLARAVWLMNRADRMQEGYALRQAQEVSKKREDRLHAQIMRLKMTAESAQLLAKSVARERYVTTPADLKLMQGLHEEGDLKEMGDIALALFCQLQKPGAPGPGEESGEDEVAKRHRVMNKIRAIFGLPPLKEESDADAVVGARHGVPSQGSQQDAGGTEGDGAEEAEVAPGFSPAHPALNRGATEDEATSSEDEDGNPYPEITAEEWERREPVRQLLENILTRQVQGLEAERHELLRESVEGPSPFERAAEIAPTQRNARNMQRMQDSNSRQVTRVTSLLMKMKRHERLMEAYEEVTVGSEAPRKRKKTFSSDDVADNKHS